MPNKIANFQMEQVAKQLGEKIQEIYPSDMWGSDELIVMDVDQTNDHGYVSNCATILWECPMENPWTYDLDGQLQSWVDERFNWREEYMKQRFFIEAYSSWMLTVRLVRN